MERGHLARTSVAREKFRNGIWGIALDCKECASIVLSQLTWLGEGLGTLPQAALTTFACKGLHAFAFYEGS